MKIDDKNSTRALVDELMLSLYTFGIVGAVTVLIVIASLISH